MKLYHFTAEENLSSIEVCGLLSIPVLEKSGISFTPNSDQNSRDIDRKKGLQNYVRLCRSPEHKMAKKVLNEQRVRKLVWLEVNNSVLDFPNTRFCKINATTNGAEIEEDKFAFLNSEDTQAEVLVYQQIPKSLITFPMHDSPTAVYQDKVPF